MEFFNSSISQSLAANSENPQADVTAIGQHTEVTPVSKLSDVVTSLSVYDYLGGLAILLIFMAIWRIIAQALNKPQSKRCSDIELLERIWKMEAAKIRD